MFEVVVLISGVDVSIGSENRPTLKTEPFTMSQKLKWLKTREAYDHEYKEHVEKDTKVLMKIMLF